VSEQCVRGCAKPCHCEDCKVKDTPDHAPIPVEANEGLLCKRCAGRLEGWLADVLNETAHLDTRKIQIGGITEGKHQKVSGSPSLIRLDVAALTDMRTKRDEDGNLNEPISIPFIICSWARLLTEEHDIETPVGYMSQAVNLLRQWWDTLVTELWVDDFYNDMQQIQRLINNANMVERPRPVGLCINVFEVDGRIQDCDNPLYASADQNPDDIVRLRCNKCGRKYNDHVDVMRVRVQQAHRDRKARQSVERTG
jgi:hypothetical protein